MFEPAPVRRSRRGQTKEVAKRSEADLIEYIKTLTTLSQLGVLRAQMESEMIPTTKAVKKALEKQEEEIAQEQEDDVASPSEIAEEKRRLQRQLRKLGQRPRKSNLFFGPGTRRKSRGRRAMEADANADLQAELEAENARIQAEAPAAAAFAAPAAAAFAAPAAAAAENARMNALANMLSATHLGPRNAVPYATTKKGVPGYHFSEEGGSRRSRRKGRSRGRR